MRAFSTILVRAPLVSAEPIGYAICQAGCAGAVMACYAAAGWYRHLFCHCMQCGFRLMPSYFARHALLLSHIESTSDMPGQFAYYWLHLLAGGAQEDEEWHTNWDGGQ